MRKKVGCSSRSWWFVGNLLCYSWGMNSEQTNLASLLDKVRSHYPYGIPKEAIVAPRASEQVPSAAVTPAPRCLFVVILEAPALTQAQGDLIDAICTKGLKIAREECVSVVLSTETSPTEVQGTIERVGARLSVVLGGPAAHGTVTASKTGTVIHTHSLPSIAENVAIKREFWGLLQAHSG